MSKLDAKYAKSTFQLFLEGIPGKKTRENVIRALRANLDLIPDEEALGRAEGLYAQFTPWNPLKEKIAEATGKKIGSLEDAVEALFALLIMLSRDQIESLVSPLEKE